jgi:hypothetical protein
VKFDEGSNTIADQYKEKTIIIANQANQKVPCWYTIMNTASHDKIDYFANLNVPCWFTTEGDIKKICFFDNRIPLTSEVEKEYEDYRNNNVHHQQYEDTKRDYAIVLRLNTKSKHKVFVLAGIHQHGTWIAGEFLRRLADKFRDESNCSITKDQRQIFLQTDCDFAAIITGDFSKMNLAVGCPKIFNDYLWFRAETGWVQISSPRWLHTFHSTCPSAEHE